MARSSFRSSLALTLLLSSLLESCGDESRPPFARMGNSVRTTDDEDRQDDLDDLSPRELPDVPPPRDAGVDEDDGGSE